jgi:hypothetical protein
MEFLKRLFNSDNCKKRLTQLITFSKKIFIPNNWKDWFKDGLEDFAYSLLGNFLPFWASLVVYFLEDGFNSKIIYNALHQPYTYLILSGTYLTSIFYLQSRPNMENRILKFFYFPLLIIIGLLVSKKAILEDLTAPFYLEITVVVLFLLCFLVHTFLLFRSHEVRLNMDPRKFVIVEKENLEEEFDKTE